MCITDANSSFVETDLKLFLALKAVPYTFVRRAVPVSEHTYPEPSAYRVGWPVPFLSALISPVLLPVTHLLLGEQ